MKRFVLISGLLFAATIPLCAQNWTSQDSLRLQQLLRREGEIELNPDALKELQVEPLMGNPQSVTDKPWLDFDATMPRMPQDKKKVRLTLHPYTANTRYDWDPVYQKKIHVDEHTWRGPFHKLTTLPEEFASAARPSGHDFMRLFTKEFWNFKGKKRRAATRTQLRMYGDSITVQEKRFGNW